MAEGQRIQDWASDLPNCEISPGGAVGRPALPPGVAVWFAALPAGGGGCCRLPGWCGLVPGAVLAVVVFVAWLVGVLAGVVAGL